MTRFITLAWITLLIPSAAARAEELNIAPADVTLVEVSARVLHDKIRGGLLGQMLGNLNGVKHEMKYIDEPGNVKDYVPALPKGARTDDDTDFEWVYVIAMQDENQILLPYSRIAELWRKRINRGIYCSNRYARRLMDLGIEPPLTGSTVLNPWAEFNISGQFLCETFGLMAPGMPQTASRIGLNYTRVAIDDEPAQSTQLFCTMIACAFLTHDVDKLLDDGLAALDPKSRQREIVTDVRQWHRQYPTDWRTTRRLLKEKYYQADGGQRDRNGYELTTGSTVAALLYGKGDLAGTLQTAFNFGWDADNTAATAGTIVGVMRGYRNLMANDWQIVDRYRNTTRDNMPMDETITSYADRVTELAEKIICEQGGKRTIVDGRPAYVVPTERPGNVHPLVRSEDARGEMRAELREEITTGILQGTSKQQQARAAYLAICLDMAPELAERHPDPWRRAIAALNGYQELISYLYSKRPGTPAHKDLVKRATAAGVVPEKKRK